MRVLQNLAFPGPSQVQGLSFDPEREWDVGSLLLEIKMLEERLYGSGDIISFNKHQESKRHVGPSKTADKRGIRPFVMRLPDGNASEHEDDMDKDDDDNSNRHGLVNRKQSAPGDHAMKRFVMHVSDDDGGLDNDDGYLDSDDDGLDNNKGNLIEASLSEMINEFQLSVQEEIRSQSSAMKHKLAGNNQKLKSSLEKIAKFLESRRDLDRKVDTEFRRMLAETVDNHLTAIRRDHEVKSQVEERKLMSDAAEEAKRKEKALHEEKLRQEKAKAEAEAKLKEEEAKRHALEAERKEKETADKLAAAIAQEAAARLAQESVSGSHPDSGSAAKKSDAFKASKSALEAEQNRMLKLKEFDEMIQILKSKQVVLYSKDFSSHERHMARLIRTISGTKDNVRTRASELIKLMSDPAFPKPISIVTFCKKVLLHCKSYNIAVVFGCAHLIVVVTSKVILSMDILLAEFHQACIFTVPKSTASKSQYESEAAYYKALGFQEDGGKIEKEQDFMKGIESYMKLYGAIVQTEVEGHYNSHGLAEGWSWLARFLNALPANKYTTIALNAFLQTAGFALHRKYKSQFRKMLKVIAEDYLTALKGREDLVLHQVIAEIQSYIKDQKFLRRPEGSVLEASSMSSQLAPV
ncbi:hypothetical protein MLD38_003220 [Melastoma candidum]|uniref:Uncharacterized protein n=1 Tax=Melastoma candidum TaxID=119954 RepID=A0ACB9SAF2_9MYRT|nr:hypothetical protein MLD38_003220 [Melastoma candidum]